VRDRGPRESYRPDATPPSVHALHQPGIATPVLDHLAFAALDVRTRDLRGLLGALTAAAEREMRAGGAATVTLGLGPSLFDARLGLAARRPAALCDLPAFDSDRLDPGACGGDLGVQACADARAHADDALARVVAAARTGASLRWSQRAAMVRAPGERPDGRPRNLLGFKEATGNPRRPKDLDRHVWVTGRERSWMLGGTFLVVRKVEVRLARWNALAPAEQERVIGRHRHSGAPLGRTHEFERMPDDDSVPADAHARIAAPAQNGGLTILRRGYSYDAGVVLLLCQRDPRRQFVPLQRRLDERDALRRFTRTVGSAIFAVPPGAPPGQPLGHGLLA